MIHLKRIYEPPSPEDGCRVLVERLWPRGITKERADLDLWLKEIAPSPDLRTWFGHDPAKWPEFRRRYRAELSANTSSVDQLKEIAAKSDTTLVYAAKDTQHNAAVVLKDFLADIP